MILGSGLIWLPLVNQMADANRGPDTTLLVTSILANIGLLALIGLNFWLNQRRKR